MANRVKVALLGVGYPLLAHKVQKLVRRMAFSRVMYTSVFLFSAVAGFILNLHFGSLMKVTNEQARVYSGILAGVIPILLLSLYVDSAGRWEKLQVTRKSDNEKIAKVEEDSQTIQAALLDLEKQIDQHGRGLLSPEQRNIFDKTYLDYNRLKDSIDQVTLSYSNFWKREGTKVVITSIQLFLCLLGEALALFSVLAPTTRQIRLATEVVIVLLFLFGSRLLAWPSAISDGRAVKVLNIFGGPMLIFLFGFSLANISNIRVLG